MAKATPSKKDSPKPPRKPRVRKTVEQQLAELDAKRAEIEAKVQAESGKKQDAANAVADAEDLVRNLLVAAAEDASKLPELRKSIVAFSAAVKEADKLGALGTFENPAESSTEPVESTGDDA